MSIVRQLRDWLRSEKSHVESLAATAAPRGFSRREALGFMTSAAAAASTLALPGCGEDSGTTVARWEEQLKGSFRLMKDEERGETIRRLERLARVDHGVGVHIKGTPAPPNTLFGYAFNISKCRGYRKCVEACKQENNQDRKSDMAYIRIFEMKKGKLDLEDGKADFSHQVPAEGHFYVGVQCFQCGNPPCVEVCPVGATWKEPDGITVVDYDWCIGCRYCVAACPYWARRFNWNAPEVPRREMNCDQHYLGNRMRKKGVVEKCTYCIQRSREGRLPACAEACPTGARVFGNLLDPNSEIRYVLENKKVFRLKEDLGTDPKFWYFMD